MSDLSIVLAQINITVGDLSHNCKKIIKAIQRASDEFSADIIAFPELALTGYSLEDLLLREDFLADTEIALQHIQANMPEKIIAIIGYPERVEEKLYNSAAIITRHQFIAHHHKQCLPNYGVFDEKRYFTADETNTVFTCKNTSIGLVICEDFWFPSSAKSLKAKGASIVISINASPFDKNKIARRQRMIRERAAEVELPVLYVNHSCAQDDLIFDGSSFIANNNGQIIAQAPFAEEILMPVKFDSRTKTLSSPTQYVLPDTHGQLYQALVMGVRDYVRKNHFQQVLLGFSGGIDSALTLAIAVDALGKENVLAVLMPSRYTSALSIDAAYEQLQALDVSYKEISIEPAFNAFLETLGMNAKNPPDSLTTQNLQARIRGTILMALSNEHNRLLLNTSNKTEMSVGYGTLYGDMCGGYAVLKDVWKTKVYALAHYRNQLTAVIPETILARAPSAELAPNQEDCDHLPPYDILDPILEAYIEQDRSEADIISAGFLEETVRKVIRLVKLSEYKRRQSAPGPRVTPRAFTRDRRYPITSGY